MKELQTQLAPKKVFLTLSPTARTWLAKNGHDLKMGARPLSRLMQKEIKDRLSDDILFGKLQKGGVVVIDAMDDRLTFDY